VFTKLYIFLFFSGIRCGFNARYNALDDFVVSDLSQESTVVFSVSTAGQGEFPTNGQEFWKALSEITDAALFSNVNFGVLGLGDSHYWPGEDGLKYFCLPAVELYEKMQELGAHPLLSIGKADDQHSDGHETVFSSWKAELWTALGVGVDPASIAESAPSKLPPDDVIKRESNYLRGTIAKGLADTSTGSMAEIDAKLLKVKRTQNGISFGLCLLYLSSSSMVSINRMIEICGSREGSRTKRRHSSS